MRRTALLVHPWICDYAAYDFWIQPLGLLFVGGFLAGRGWQVHLADALAGGRDPQRRRWDGTSAFLSVPLPDPLPPPPGRGPGRSYRRYGIPLAEFERRIEQIRAPDAILVSLQMTYWYPALDQALGVLTRVHPAVPIYLGGGYATLARSHAALRPGLTALVSSRNPLPALTQLCGLLGEDAPRADEVAGLTARWSLCEELPHAPVMTSWGCPFHCPYCATAGTFGPWRPRSHEAILEELQALSCDLRAEHLACYDDALLHQAGEHFLPLARKLVLAGLGAERFRWHFPNAVHARWIDREVAAALRQLGAATLWLGAESCDAGFLARTGGKVTPAEVERALSALEAQGARPRQLGAYLLAGVPGLPDESVARAMDRLHGLGLHIALASYSPIPGTPFFASLAAEEPRLEADPLWQNNTRREMDAPGRWESLRAQARDLNRRLDQDGLPDPGLGPTVSGT